MARKPKPGGRKLADKGKMPGRSPVEIRATYPRFLIVCEGEETERNYFEKFRTNVTIKTIGTGKNTLSLVVDARKYAEQDDYNQIWVVFDLDSFPPDDFNSAIEQAQNAGFQAAYSNEAFELWYVLHFDYMDSAISREQYIDILNEKVGKYRKNDLTMYDKLQPRQETALRNARRLMENYSPHNPAQDNPCTTVHQLVDELNRYSR
jgi:hypothetical protein